MFSSGLFVGKKQMRMLSSSMFWGCFVVLLFWLLSTRKCGGTFWDHYSNSCCFCFSQCEIQFGFFTLMTALKSTPKLLSSQFVMKRLTATDYKSVLSSAVQMLMMSRSFSQMVNSLPQLCDPSHTALLYSYTQSATIKL